MTPRLQAIDAYDWTIDQAITRGIEHEVERQLCQTDLFYLLTVVLGRKDLNHDWLFARCREVQAEPDGYLDLWFREGGKSSIITFGLTIQDILNDPEVTVGIFSFNRPTAKQFLRQIKREFEDNERLKGLFPDILWAEPKNEAPTWSEDSGIVVKRRQNPKESTVEAWGLVDGQPTSRHFRLMVYDDVVTGDSVTTPDMIEKVTRAWETSLNLGMVGGRARYIGTRWHYADTYRTILDRESAKERRYPVTVDGTIDGEPVLWTREVVAEKRKAMTFTFGAQMLLDPAADSNQGFLEAWLRYYEDAGDFAGLNKYLMVDAASDKKKGSDYTAIAVIGLGADDNMYLLDAIRDRLSLGERADAVFSLHRRWKPKLVAYERYGMMADVEYLKERMGRDNYRFEIVEVGGQMSKRDRIKRMGPIFESGRFLLPLTLPKADTEGVRRDLVHDFIRHEYLPFPVADHDDLFDAISRIWDISAVWPKPVVKEDRWARPRQRRRTASAWAA
jgi:predicted phage terminase large subunit-like protein